MLSELLPLFNDPEISIFVQQNFSTLILLFSRHFIFYSSQLTFTDYAQCLTKTSASTISISVNLKNNFFSPCPGARADRNETKV